jgi:hypothetical protein
MGGIMIPVGSTIEYTGKGLMLSSKRVGQTGLVLSYYTRYSEHFRAKVQILKVLWSADGKEQSVFASNVAYLRTESTWEV